jgi:hypothetical protein
LMYWHKCDNNAQKIRLYDILSSRKWQFSAFSLTQGIQQFQ